MSPNHAWVDMDSPLSHSGNLPPHPIPYRQPSYAEAQKQFSPSLTGSITAAQNSGEMSSIGGQVDDGGWTVDKGARDYTERRRRKKERSRGQSESAFGIMHGMSQLAVTPAIEASNSQESSSPTEQDGLLHKGPEGKAVDADNAVAGQNNANDKKDEAALVDSLGRSGFHVDHTTLSRIRQLLHQHQPQQAIPKREVETPPTDNVAITEQQGREYTGPWTGTVPPHMRHACQHDPNRLAVANPKPWGGTASKCEPVSTAASPLQPTPGANEAEAAASDGGWAPDTTTSEAKGVGAESEGGWAPDDKVRNWVKDVHPATPPSRSPPPLPLTPRSDSFPSRPDSTPPVPNAVTIYVSDDESTPDTDLPTPGKNDVAPSSTIIPDRAASPSPAHSSARVEQRSGRGTNEADRRPRGRSQRQIERSGVLWKRDPHPAFSAKFARRRILVQFPFPIRMDATKQTMMEHFSKYGSIRLTWCHEPHGDSCEKVLVVFDNEESVEACLADPAHTTCMIKSASGHAGITPVDIHVTSAPVNLTNKTVFIKVNGKRADARSRSASPLSKNERDQDRTRHNDSAEWHVQDLPVAINIDAVPSRKRTNGMVEWWARVRNLHVSFDNVVTQSRRETRYDAQPITTMDLGRRVAERDIIPRLCEYFAEIVDIIPPTCREQGWLVTGGGTIEARNLMAEVGKIPGILIRWAHPEDGLVREEEDMPRKEEQSPMTQLEQDFGGKMSRDDAFRTRSNRGRNPHHARPNALELHTSIAPPKTEVNAEDIRNDSPIQPKETPDVAQSVIPADVIDPRYPHLRKRVVPTYRGRTLREDLSGENPRFFDDSAIFVGRLVKQQETESSLFQRFSRYGQICGIEYNPNIVHSTYATARVLFSTKAAADRALQFEQEAISFGSLLKVENRRVLSSDVQLEERYIDDWGRAYSPSMVSQYSPPQLPAEDDLLFVQPPPLNTAAAPMPPSFFAPPAFWQCTPYPIPPEASPGMPSIQANSTSGAQPGPPASPHPGPLRPVPFGPMGPHPSLMPVLYAMGVGFYPHGMSRPAPVAHDAQVPLPTPPVTPHLDQQPDYMQSTGATNPIAHHLPTDTILGQPAPPASQPADPSASPSSSAGRRRSPKVAEVRMENGMFKVIYDTDDLKRFCREEGCPEPKSRDGSSPGAATTNIVPHQVEVAPQPAVDELAPRHVRPPIEQSTPQQRLQPVPIPFSPPQTAESSLYEHSGSGTAMPSGPHSRPYLQDPNTGPHRHMGARSQQHHPAIDPSQNGFISEGGIPQPLRDERVGENYGLRMDTYQSGSGVPSGHHGAGGSGRWQVSQGGWTGR